MTSARLSALDASFLNVESPTAHMHVGWVARFAGAAEAGRPSFRAIRNHIERRIGRAPRYRQKLASVPLSVQTPEWVDDPAFAIERHVYWAPGPLEGLVDEVMSIPLRRDRPLWEMWICEDGNDGFAIVGKSHHCMVDGIAAVELASLLLDFTPEPVAYESEEWRAAQTPGSEWMLARGVRDLIGGQADLLALPLRVASSPGPAARQTVAGLWRAVRAVDQLLRSAPPSILNTQLSPLRTLASAQRPLAELKTIKQAYGTTLNDVALAAVAGGLRRFLLRRGEQPIALKVMVPVSVRSPEDVLGNHISFVFADLPCDDPDPVGRLYQVHASMSRCKREGEPQGSDLVLKAAGRTPVAMQQALSQVIASPRAFNLTVSNIPGPPQQTYMLGCPLRSVYPMVPLTDNHAVSVAMITIHDQACFGVYGDREALPDVGLLAADIDDAITELLAGTHRVMESPGSLLNRARATASENGYEPRAEAFGGPRPGAPVEPARQEGPVATDRRSYPIPSPAPVPPTSAVPPVPAEQPAVASDGVAAANNGGRHPANGGPPESAARQYERELQRLANARVSSARLSPPPASGS